MNTSVNTVQVGPSHPPPGPAVIFSSMTYKYQYIDTKPHYIRLFHQASHPKCLRFLTYRNGPKNDPIRRENGMDQDQHQKEQTYAKLIFCENMKNPFPPKIVFTAQGIAPRFPPYLHIYLHLTTTLTLTWACPPADQPNQGPRVFFSIQSLPPKKQQLT